MSDAFSARLLDFLVRYRMFEDACRQLRDSGGGDGLMGETLRLALDAVDSIDSLEEAIPEAVESAQRSGDEDLLDGISFLAESLREDRARASSYYSHVTSVRLGMGGRPVRRPKVVFPIRVRQEDRERDAREDEGSHPETPDDVESPSTSDDHGGGQLQASPPLDDAERMTVEGDRIGIARSAREDSDSEDEGGRA